MHNLPLSVRKSFSRFATRLPAPTPHCGEDVTHTCSVRTCPALTVVLCLGVGKGPKQAMWPD